MPAPAASALANPPSPESLAKSRRAAMKKAYETRAWERVEPYTFVDYGVTGSRGDFYLVSLHDPERGGEASCTCQASLHLRPCYHICSVLLAICPDEWRSALVG